MNLNAPHFCDRAFSEPLVQALTVDPTAKPPPTGPTGTGFVGDEFKSMFKMSDFPVLDNEKMIKLRGSNKAYTNWMGAPALS
jgi:hypothetical protein